MTPPDDGPPRLVPTPAVMALLERTNRVLGGGDGTDLSGWTAMIAVGMQGLRRYGVAPGTIVDLCRLLCEVYAEGESWAEPGAVRDAPAAPPAGGAAT